LAVASKPLFFYTTCDRQYDFSDLKKLLPEIDKVHLVSGFRLWQPVPAWLRGLGMVYRLILWLVLGFAPERLPGWLGWKEQLYRLVIRAVFAVRLRDINCLFRLFRRDIFARIPLQSSGDFVHTEIVAKANFLGCYMHDEVTVVYRPPEGRERGPVWDDLRRVFSHPDFGPVVVPPPAGG
jgi:hypothetical protein